MIERRILHMPELTPAFVAYLTNTANKLFVESGVCPPGEEGFAFLLAIRLIDVSRNCRTREGHKRLVETAIRSMVSENVAGFVEHRRQAHKLSWWHSPLNNVGMSDDDRLVSDLVEIARQHEFGEALRYYVEHWLFDHAREIFDEQRAIVVEDGSKITEHPMRTFTAYLNEIEYLKAVDPSAYRRDADRFHRVVALRRVGLAILPPETWRARVVLSDGTLPRTEWKRTAARRLRWPVGWALAGATGTA